MLAYKQRVESDCTWVALTILLQVERWPLSVILCCDGAGMDFIDQADAPGLSVDLFFIALPEWPSPQAGGRKK